MSDIKTAVAYNQLERAREESQLWQRRFDYIMTLTPRAFAELQQLSLTSGLSITQLIDGWVLQS